VAEKLGCTCPTQPALERDLGCVGGGSSCATCLVGLGIRRWILSVSEEKGEAGPQFDKVGPTGEALPRNLNHALARIGHQSRWPSFERAGDSATSD
jgi:hypothetical protein